MKKLLILACILPLLSCEKEELESTVYRKIRPIEGIFEGQLYYDCPTFGLDKQYSSTITVTAVNSEELTINNRFYSGSAQITTNGLSYSIIHMYWVDISDCKKDISYSFTGSGFIKGDSLIENGSFILKHNSVPYQGTYKVRAAKLK